MDEALYIKCQGCTYFYTPNYGWFKKDGDIKFSCSGCCNAPWIIDFFQERETNE